MSVGDPYCCSASQWPGPHLQCRDPIQWQLAYSRSYLLVSVTPLSPVLPETSGTGIAQLVERLTNKPGAVLTRIRQGISFSCSPRASFLCNCLTVVKFQCKLSSSANTSTVSVRPLCAFACVNIYAHVKNPKHWQPHHCLDAQRYDKH